MSNEKKQKRTLTEVTKEVTNEVTKKVTQQTAVEWLLNAIETKNGEEFSSYYSEFIQQAKELEKEQIINAHGDEQSKLQDDGTWKVQTAEQYYNETYGGNK
jgi:2,4-dienoyl-CoA reductase-like NADH-dependent reductase (Old Yellow Enzyme family)